MPPPKRSEKLSNKLSSVERDASYPENDIGENRARGSGLTRPDLDALDQMRLRLRVRPKPGEGAVDQALRLALRNGFSGLAPFLAIHDIGFKPSSFAEDLKKLAEMSGLPLELTSEWTMSPIGRRTVDFRGECIPRGALLPGYRRYCPCCFDEDILNAPADEPEESVAYLRGWWRLSIIYACPKHGCAMWDHCPECESRIPLGSLPLHRCPCGFDLRKAIPENLKADELAANQYLLGRFAIGERMESPMLDAIPAWQGANVLRRLGAAALLGKRETVKIAVGKLDRDIAYDQPPVTLGRLLSAGFEYAKDGSASLVSLMEKMIEGDQRLYKGPADMFGSKFRSWAIHEDNPIKEAIQEVWDPFVARHCRPTRRTNPTLGPRPAHLAVKPQRLHPLEQARFEAAVGRTFPPMMTRSDALAIGKSEGVLLSREQVRQRSGLRLQSFSKLVAACLIRPIWYSDVPHAEPYYADDVSAFFDSLAAHSRGKPPSRGRMFLRSAIIENGPIVAPILISSVLRGELEAFGALSDNLSTSIYVASRTVRRGRISALNRTETGSILGVDSDTVDQLVVLGHLGVAPDQECSMISVDAVVKFDSDHITAARLGHICSSAMAAGYIEDWLLGLAVPSILTPGRPAIFSRGAAIRAFYQNWSWDLEPPGLVSDTTFSVTTAAA